MRDPIAATKLSDVLRPQPQGELVNVHVVDAVREPSPDFEAMRRLIGEKAKDPSSDPEKRD